MGLGETDDEGEEPVQRWSVVERQIVITAVRLKIGLIVQGIDGIRIICEVYRRDMKSSSRRPGLDPGPKPEVVPRDAFQRIFKHLAS
jgi:hypothetical protein